MNKFYVSRRIELSAVYVSLWPRIVIFRFTLCIDTGGFVAENCKQSNSVMERLFKMVSDSSNVWLFTNGFLFHYKLLYSFFLLRSIYPHIDRSCLSKQWNRWVAKTKNGIQSNCWLQTIKEASIKRSTCVWFDNGINCLAINISSWDDWFQNATNQYTDFSTLFAKHFFVSFPFLSRRSIQNYCLPCY